MKLPSPVRRRHSRIEIIPLIDIMFFLLAAFMMVSLQLDRTKNIKVNVPSATQAQHDFKPDMISIAVDTNGVVWLEKTNLSLAQLGQTVSNRFRTDTNVPVFISGDQNTRHGAMADVLEAVRNAGVQRVAFTVGSETKAKHP